MKYIFLLFITACTNPSNQPAPVDSVQPAQRLMDSLNDKKDTIWAEPMHVEKLNCIGFIIDSFTTTHKEN